MLFGQSASRKERALPRAALLAEPGEPQASLETQAGTSRLAETNAVATRTIDVGASILSELGTQRETLVAARSTQEELREALSRSSTLLKGMLRRAAANKLLLKGVIALLLTAILALILVKWGPKGHPPPAPAPTPP